MDWLQAADRGKGKLRTFLLTAFRRFIAKEWRKMRAEIRGGGVAPVPLGDAEEHYAVARAGMPAEEIFDLDFGTLNQTRPPTSLGSDHPDTVRAWRNMGFDACFHADSGMLVFPTLTTILSPVPGEWDQPDLQPSALMQHLNALLSFERNRQQAPRPDRWAGIFQGRLGGRTVEWRVVAVDGELHWLETASDEVSEQNRLLIEDGALVIEDQAKRFRFSRNDSTTLLFEAWARDGGKKLREATLIRVEGP